MKNFALCVVILIFGTIAVQNFTNANEKYVSSPVVELGYELSDSDLDKINGIVDEKIGEVSRDLRTVESDLSKRIDELQKQLTDCNTRTEAMAKASSQPVVKSGGSSGSAVANRYEAKPAVVKSSGGSSGTVVQNVYSQPVVSQPVYSAPVVRSSNHWSYPGDISTHMQTAHGQDVYGMSVEQQLSLHDSIHESQRGGVTRTVTRSNVQASNCPGGVCPTNASTVTRSYSRPRWFGR